MLGLQYQSLKTVLQHTDANTRFRINLHMPSIRSVEKLIPLKMDSLELRGRSTKVNDTSYRFGIFRFYPHGNAPQRVKSDNRMGGSDCDFDGFGFPDSLSYNVILPGDISFRERNWIEERRDTEVDERMYRDDLRVHEKALEKLTELKSKGITVKDYLQTLEPLPENEFGKEHKIRYYLQYPEHLPYHIECDKLDILPFDCRRNNTKPPFTCYIQLTTEKGSTRTIRRFEYTKKLFEAVKYFHEVLFGGRPMPIRVDSLHLSFMLSFDGPIRLPIGFRLQVGIAHVSGDTVAHRSFPLLVKNADDLSSLWMYHNSDLNGFQSRVVRNAKRVVIPGAWEHNMQRLVRVLREISNPEFSILPISMSSFSPENYFTLIEAWLAGDRQVGASCWMRMGDDKTARQVLKLVRTRYERTKRSKRCVTIRRNDATKVEIFYVPFKGPVKDSYTWKCKWVMKARIVKV